MFGKILQITKWALKKQIIEKHAWNNKYNHKMIQNGIKMGVKWLKNFGEIVKFFEYLLQTVGRYESI